MKKSSLYTRTGDTGMTSLIGGTRVKKNSVRIAAYGDVDELNSHIGVLVTSPNLLDEFRSFFIYIQNKLFNIGAYLATDNPSNVPTECQGLGQDAISRLEQEIDRLDAEVPPFTQFILPGGSRRSALAHVCRTVCRRCERSIIALDEISYVDPNVIRFINRLSDFLFVFARYNNVISQIDETFWDKDC